MAAINGDNAAAWQRIADDVSKQRPNVGRRVRVTRGKRKGQEGIVQRHQVSRYTNAFRYGSDGNLALREMAGRYGYCCLVKPDDGPAFWVDADKVDVL